MKKSISFLLAMILMFSCFGFHSPNANALGAVWVKEFYKDKFGDITDKYYLTNKSQFYGTFNSDSVSDGELEANLIFERDRGVLSAYTTLFFNGNNLLKSVTSTVSFDISVKRPDGSVFDTSGDLPAGENRIEILASIELAQALREHNGTVKIYIENSYNKNNNYLFAVDCGNFNDLYTKEILVPYQEEKYQEAEHLLEEKKFDEAAEVFLALGDYKDSAARLEEIIEAKNADAYSAAVELMEKKEYEKAIKAFEALGDYKDSAARLEEIIEAKNADAYAVAVELLEKEEYEKAIKAFEALGDYKDSAEQIESIRMRAAQKISRFKNVGYTVKFGSYEQNNDISNGKEPIEWIVLKYENNKCLLMSRYGLDSKEYHARRESVTWENCTLRSWLNNSFMDEAFSDGEKSAICKTKVDNSKDQGNKEWSTSGGNNTIDQVFLLSCSEFESLVNSSSLKICKPTAYAEDKGAIPSMLGTSPWYLRSPGSTQNSAALINVTGSISHSYYVDNKQDYVVRPVLWIDLNSKFFCP